MPNVRLDTSLEALLERLRVLDAPCALLTLVATSGSTYRKAGARMLIESDGHITGLLSGGCLEQDLRDRVHAVLDGAAPIIVEYDMRGADDLIFGIGAGCEGAMRILIERASAGGRAAVALDAASRASRAGLRAALIVGLQGEPESLGTRAYPAPDAWPLDAALARACAEAVGDERSRSVRVDRRGVAQETWIQFVAPTPRILVCGGGADAQPLVALFGMLGMAVTVVDHRPALVDGARFPGARVLLAPPDALGTAVVLDEFIAAVVMSHHLAADAGYLRSLAAASVPYVGLLGPQPRRERLLAQLGATARFLGPRLRGPVGLDIGAETPDSIALAIVAEIHAFAAGRSGGPYGDRVAAG
jgi:xanthine dehydrogenase accessory factor